jgi:hypothetical protein
LASISHFVFNSAIVLSRTEAITRGSKTSVSTSAFSSSKPKEFSCCFSSSISQNKSKSSS